MEIQIGLDVAARLTGKQADELAGLFEGIEDQKEIAQTFENAVGDHFSTLRKRIAADKRKQGQREKGEAVEKALSDLFDRYGIEGFDTAEDGIAQLSEKLTAEPPKGEPGELTTEQITSHATYQALQRKLDAANEARKNLQAEYEGFKTDIHTRSVLSAARSATAQFLEENNAVKGNATYDKVAEFFLATVDPSRIGLNEGKPVWLDEDGQPLTDKLGNPVSWGQGVRDRYELGFNVADPGKGGSGAPAGSGGKGGGGGLVVRSRDEAQRLLQQHQGDKAMTAKINNAYSEFLDSQG